jgi:hypothetical protein
MQFRVDHLTPCCGDQPSLDTWDKNEARSVRCVHCGRQTASHWGKSAGLRGVGGDGGQPEGHSARGCRVEG